MQVFVCISDNFQIFVKQVIRLTADTAVLIVMHVLLKMKFLKRLHQICLHCIIYRAKLSVSSTTTGFIRLCVSSTSAGTA